MNEQIISALIGSVLIKFHITLVICLVRKIISNKFSPISIHVISAICTLSILFILVMTQIGFNFWLAFSIVIFGICACLFVFGAVYKSLSIRFLLITNREGKQASFDLLDTLVTNVSFSERTKILCDMGLAIKENEGFQISKKGMHVANRIVWVRKLFGIKTTGLY